MADRSEDRRHRFLALAGLVLYAVFVFGSQFEHHDLLCELKTPLHCTSCTATQLGSDPQALLYHDVWRLADAGRAVAVLFLSDDTLLTVRSTGRSPPAHA